MSGPAIELESHPDLETRSELEVARRELASYETQDAEQEQTRARILEWTVRHANAAERSCLSGHLTASALVVDANFERTLLTLHRKLGRWLQLGGHCDGDTNLKAVAWREALEESGFTPAAISARPIDLDIHEIPARRAEPAHLHLDTRYLVVAPDGAEAIRSDESTDLRWFTRRECSELELDASLRRLIVLALEA